jgi:hypothetical protein
VVSGNKNQCSCAVVSDTRRHFPFSFDILHSYVKSAIRTPEMEAFLYSHGVRMAQPEDCVAAMMRLACDRTINGKLLPF